MVTLDGEILPALLLHADDLAAVQQGWRFETLLVRDGRACLVGSAPAAAGPISQVDGPSRTGLPGGAARRGGNAAVWGG